MVDGVLRREERRRQIVVAVLDLDPQVRVGHERLRQVRADVRRRGPATLTITRPVPLPLVAASHQVAVLRVELQLATEVRIGRRRRSEEHTSELQSRELISYAVFCLK